MLQCMVGPWIESMSHTSLPIAWEGRLKKGESILLTFSFKPRRGRMYEVYVKFVSGRISLYVKHNALLILLNFSIPNVD